jgi:hypothetical protein
MIQVITDFSYDYEIEVLDEIPNGSEPVHYFDSRNGGNDGLMLRITPKNSDSWIGMFLFGNKFPKAFKKVFSCPNENSLCVV